MGSTQSTWGVTTKPSREMSASRVPVTMRDFFFDDPFFKNSWEDFDRVRDAMFTESREKWLKFDEDFRNMACMSNNIMLESSPDTDKKEEMSDPRSLAVTGAWMYFSPRTSDWFPVISMLIYMLAAPLGLCSIPFLYIAEFYPSELRSVLAGLTTMITNILMAIAIKTFTNLDSLLGHYGLVWLYSAACFGAILLTLSYVPETKDRSLTVINDKFARLRKTVRASPWVTPLPSPSVNSVRKFQYKSQMFTQ